MRTLGLITLVALPLLAACVTINVYFPSAAAEKAADRIINDVWGPRSGEDQPDKESGNDSQDAGSDGASQSRYAPDDPGGGALAAVAHVLDWVIPAAHAAEPDIDVSSPAIKRITRSMEARHSKLKPYYEAGAIGLTDNALIEVRDLTQVPLPKRSSVKDLVASENEDRNALYREIARANDHPEWESQIRDVFAKRWIERAPSGWYYRTSQGEWKQK